MKNQVWQDETVQALKQGYQEVIDKQIAEITALRERVEKLENVIKPFADAYKSQGDSSTNPVTCLINMSHLTIYQEWQEAAEIIKDEAQ